jgi:hypothetical protein
MKRKDQGGTRARLEPSKLKDLISLFSVGDRMFHQWIYLRFSVSMPKSSLESSDNITGRGLGT